MFKILAMALVRTAMQLSVSLCPFPLPSQECSLMSIRHANLRPGICLTGNPPCHVVLVRSSFKMRPRKNPATCRLRATDKTWECCAETAVCRTRYCV